MRISVDRAKRMRTGPGFTIIELLVSISVIAILVGLLVVVGRLAVRYARESSTRRTVQAMKVSVEQFRQDHGFLPPLVMDERIAGVSNHPQYPTYIPGVNPPAPRRPIFAAYRVSLSADPNDPQKVVEREYLRGYQPGNAGGLGGPDLDADTYAGPIDRRFSTYSLGVYLAGLGEVTYGSGNPKAVIDGVVGPGSKEPSEDGTWEVSADANRARTGKQYGPKFQEGAGGFKIVDVDTAAGRDSTGRVEIRDRNGVAIRYYRWLRGRPNLTTEELKMPNGTYNPIFLNVPKIVGDPATNSELASADFAIVAAGPNGYFGDMPLEAATQQDRDKMAAELGVAYSDEGVRRKAREDNIVEVGR